MNVVSVSDLKRVQAKSHVVLKGHVVGLRDFVDRRWDFVERHYNRCDNVSLELTLRDRKTTVSCVLHPWTYTRYRALIKELYHSPIMLFGSLGSDGVFVADLVEIRGISYDVTNIQTRIITLQYGDSVMIRTVPTQNSEKNSGYKISFSNGAIGLFTNLDKLDFKYGKSLLYPGIVCNDLKKFGIFIVFNIKRW